MSLLVACGGTTVRLDDAGSPAADTGMTPADAGLTPVDASGPRPDADVADAGPPDPSGELPHLRALMVGTWVGVAEAPPTWTPSRWSLQISFSADGRYEAACTEGACAPFYYDAPGPDSRHVWTVDSLTSAGEGAGTIVVVPPPGTVRQQGELTRVRYDGQLTFEFWNTWSGTRIGPIRYTLRRL